MRGEDLAPGVGQLAYGDLAVCNDLPFPVLALKDEISVNLKKSHIKTFISLIGMKNT